MRKEDAKQLFDINGRVALVTGGRSGLGMAMSEGLAAAGAKLAVVDVRDEWSDITARVKAVDGELACFQADLSDRTQRAGVVDRVVERFGRLDILVNCAGIQHRQPAVEFDLNKWDLI